ncbi:MAG: hypothetical protein HUJ30_01855 [Gammaproteobacteria bacterium]|nr:hypothetical protein [Gammaproteobacteria bacterium]
MKSLDLRLDLRKAHDKLKLDIHSTDKLLDEAMASRRAVKGGGGLTSGYMQRWQQTLDADRESLKDIRTETDTLSCDFTQLNHKELEDKLIIHNKLQLQVDKLTAKYQAEIAQDDQERVQIREAAHRRHPPS